MTLGSVVGRVPRLMGELMGTRAIDSGMQAALNYWGITRSDFLEMMKADPFATRGTEPNMPMDPARFTFVSAFAYRPLALPGHQPGSQTLALQRRTGSSTTSTQGVDYFVDARFGGSLRFLGLAEAFFAVKNKLSVSNSASRKTSTENTTTNTVTVGQPAYGYAGPTVLRVYEDRVWKTFVFNLDWY